MIDANKKTFLDRSVPQEIADMVGSIDDLFSSENWGSLLKKLQAKIEATVQKSASDADLGEEVAY
jgi:hypothetical protein